MKCVLTEEVGSTYGSAQQGVVYVCTCT